MILLYRADINVYVTDLIFFDECKYWISRMFCAKVKTLISLAFTDVSITCTCHIFLRHPWAGQTYTT